MQFCDNCAMHWEYIYYILNFLYMCTCIYWIMYWYTFFCIVCVVHWFTLNCCVMWFEFVNFLSIDCSMYLGFYCIFCVVHWIYWYLSLLGIHVHGYVLLCWKLVYFASCDCIIHVYWGITVYFVYYVLWLNLAVYICILFVSPVTYLLIRWWIWCWNISVPKSFIKICIWYLIIQSSKQSWAILIQKDWITLLCSR